MKVRIGEKNKGFDVFLQERYDMKGNGTGKYDVFIMNDNEPTKKYLYKDNLMGSVGQLTLKKLVEQGVEFVTPLLKSLKTIHVEASAPAIIRSGPPTIAPAKPGTKTKPGQTPVKAPRPIPMPDPKNTIKIKSLEIK